MAAVKAKLGPAAKSKIKAAGASKAKAVTKPEFKKAAMPPTIVQAVAWELKGIPKGSFILLSKASGISVDALRVAKRPPDVKDARPLSPSRARLLSFILAAHRRGDLDGLLEDAAEIEAGWKAAYPNGLAS